MTKIKGDPWEIAYWLAKQELRDPLYREMQERLGGGVDKMRATHEKLKTKKLEALADHPDFDALMAEARAYAAAEEARDENLRYEKIFGQLVDALMCVGGYQYKTGAQLRKFYLAHHSEPDFQDTEVEKTWRCFLDAWADWDCPGMFEYLSQLVDRAHNQLYEEHLPPVPRRKDQPKEKPTPVSQTSAYQLRQALHTIVQDGPSLMELRQYLGQEMIQDENVGEKWGRFLEAVLLRRFEKVLEALLDLLMEVYVEILWTEFDV